MLCVAPDPSEIPFTMDAAAVLAPFTSKPTRTTLFCAVKTPLSSIPFICEDVLVEAMERLWTRLRAMAFVPVVTLPE